MRNDVVLVGVCRELQTPFAAICADPNLLSVYDLLCAWNGDVETEAAAVDEVLKHLHNPECRKLWKALCPDKRYPAEDALRLLRARARELTREREAGILYLS